MFNCALYNDLIGVCRFFRNVFVIELRGYIKVFLRACISGRVTAGNGEHCQFWVMIQLEAFPTPLFATDLQLIEQFKQLILK